MDNLPSPERNRIALTRTNARPKQPSKKGCLPSGLLSWLFAAFVSVILIILLYPAGQGIQVHSPQVKAMAQAKQIGLALKLFACDHDGQYPKQGVPAELKDLPRSSNEDFACLFPTYVTSERIFGNRLSAYQTGQGPDDRIDNPYTGKPVQTLRPGENVYGYVEGLNDSADNPGTPIVLDGTDGRGYFNTAEGIRGGTWKEGKRAVVIRMDNSGTIEKLRGRDNTLYLPQAAHPENNLLDLRFLPKGTRYLDPAVAP